VLTLVGDRFAPASTAHPLSLFNFYLIKNAR
jgi:hypothetical protein